MSNLQQANSQSVQSSITVREDAVGQSTRIMDNLVVSSAAQCPACLSAQTRLHIVKNSFPIHRCHKCGTLFVHPQPSREDLGKLYSESYFSRGNKYAATLDPKHDPNWLNDESKVDLLKRWCPAGKLLDVGCALGGFLAVAREHGYDVEGVEIGEYAAEQAREKLRINVFNSDIYSAELEPESYDVITLWDVVEHLPDPNLAFERVNRALRPNGYVAFSTGDVSSVWARTTGKRWQLLTPPQHLHFFSERSMQPLLKRHGFSTKEISHEGKWATLDFILFKSQESFGRIMRPLATAIRWSGLHKMKVTVNLGDIMTVVAQKS